MTNISLRAFTHRGVLVVLSAVLILGLLSVSGGAQKANANPDHFAGDYFMFAKALFSGTSDRKANELDCNNSNDKQADFSGSNNSIFGRVHSNADLAISGSNNTFGDTLFVTNPEVTHGSNDTDCVFEQGSGNVYSGGGPTNLAGTAAPGVGTGGWPGNLGTFLTQSGAGAFETFPNTTPTSAVGMTCDRGTLTGNNDITILASDNGKVVCAGTGKIVFSLNDQGTTASPFKITMLSHGVIEIPGQNNKLAPAAHGVLAWTDVPFGTAAEGIKLNGSNTDILNKSILFAPRGGIDVSGSVGNDVCVQVIGQGPLKIAGSTSNFGPFGPNCVQEQPTGSITIIKDTVPDDPQDFSFTTTGAGLSSFNLDDEGNNANELSNTKTFTDLAAGNYSVTEGAVAGFDLTGNVTCVDPTSNSSINLDTRTATINLAAGENVTCTFVNTKIPKLTVNKVLIPNDDTGLFNLQIDGVTAGTGGNVGDGGTTGTVLVSIGSHTVGETAGTATNLDDYVVTVGGDCDAGGNVTLAAGDDKTCTITNIKKATLIVEKVMVGGTATFNFSGTPSGFISTNGGTTQAKVAPDTYNSTEIVPSGWALTDISCDDSDSSVPSTWNLSTKTATFNAEAGETITCTFTNTKLGSISGMKFEDVNGNGVKDGGDNGLANWEIKLTGDATATQNTNSSGNYSFTDLLPGTYQVCETLQSGWMQTFPTSAEHDCGDGTFGYEIVLAAGQDVAGKDFGNFKLGSISGKKFEDLDGDGQPQETGEPNLPGWTIRLYDGSTTPWPFITSQVTDGDGQYSFTNLTPGVYKVCEVLQTGWTQTFVTTGTANLSPNSAEEGPLCQTVNIGTSGETNTRNFGNFKNVTIKAFKFEDMNGDGEKDLGDTPIEGWEMTLNGDQAQDTDENGMVSWIVTTGGTFTVEEENKAGWTHTSPSSVEVFVQSGDEDKIVEFLNFQNVTISGHKFEDVNGDGVWDQPDEPGLAGWTINLGGSGSGSDTTDVNGYYEFTDLGPGTYTICETLQVDWVQTFPTSGVCPGDTFGYSVTVQSGQDVENQDFGNFKKAKLIVQKITVTTDQNDTTEFTFTGDLSGQLGDEDTIVEFVGPGTYTSTESTPPTGWVLTDVDCSGHDRAEITGATVTFTPHSGDEITCVFTNNKPGAQIDVDPLSDSNPVGQDHVITATVQVHNGDGDYVNAPDGTVVTFSLVSNTANADFVPTSGDNTCTTIDGECFVTINSTQTGSVEIHASTIPIVLGIPVSAETGSGGDNSENALKTYVDAKINIEDTGTNEVGQEHIFTVTVEADFGDGEGFVGVEGENPTVTFSPSDPTIVSNTCANPGTNASGQCTVVINSNVPGVFTATASVTIDVEDVEFVLITDGEGDNPDPAVKTYVDASIALSPLEATNPINEEHVITVTVTKDPGTGPVPAGSELVTFSLTNSGGATAVFVGGNTCTTNSSGQCSVTINSATAGTVTINASVTVSVGGLNLVRDTDPATVNVPAGPDGTGPATKTYVLENVLLIIDEDSLDNGIRFNASSGSITPSGPNFFSKQDVNDGISSKTQRSVLQYFAQNIGNTITVMTGQTGDEGWFAPNCIPQKWLNGNSDNCLAGEQREQAINRYFNGPVPAESRLDKIPHVIPLRALGLNALIGKQSCAVVYDSDVSINYDIGKPLGVNGSLKGETLGIVAFTVNAVNTLNGFSSGTLPQVTLTIGDASDCGSWKLFNAPVPRSSSVPNDRVSPGSPNGYHTLKVWPALDLFY